MVTRPVLATALVGYFVLTTIATPSSAQSDYLAPVPVSAVAACGDTAPDCAAICKDSAGPGACQSRSPIGDYLRANCKSTCGLCVSQSEATSTSPTARVPSLSPGRQLPLAYGRRSGTLSPSSCTFSCVDIPPPSSPFTCSDQERFGKCNSTFMTTPTPGLPQGYCQITCGRCYGSPSCNSRPASPSVPGTPVTSPSTVPSTPNPSATTSSSPQNAGISVQSTTASSSPGGPVTTPADPITPAETVGVPGAPVASEPSLQSTSTTSGSPANASPTASPESPQASSVPALSPASDSTSTLPPSSQPASTSPLASGPVSADTTRGTDPSPATLTNAVGQDSVAGSVVPATSSMAPETAAQSPLLSSLPVLPPLFGSPIALGSGSTPVQVYVQVPGLPPVQPIVAVPAITTTGLATSNPDSLQSRVNALSLAPAAQQLVGEIANVTPPTAALPVPQTPPAETPAVVTSTPGNFAVACLDIPPPQSTYTCAEQRDLENCDAAFMVATNPGAPYGYCQITCNRCSIPAAAEASPSAATPPASNLEPSPAMLSAADETSSTASAPATSSPLLPSGATDSTLQGSQTSGATDSTLQGSQTATSPNAPSVRSSSSPAPQGTGNQLAAAPPPLVSPYPSYTTTPQAPNGSVSNASASSQPAIPVPGTLGSVNALATPLGTSLPGSLPAPGSLTSTALAAGTPATAPSNPAECADLQSDCKFICEQMSNDCSKPGGLGDYLRANCKQTCNLCPTSSPASSCTGYTWLTGQWGTCNSTCGVGFHNRSVSCMSFAPSLSVQTRADPALCNEALEPANITSCVTKPCAADYAAACAVTATPPDSGRKLF